MLKSVDFDKKFVDALSASPCGEVLMGDQLELGLAAKIQKFGSQFLWSFENRKKLLNFPES